MSALKFSVSDHRLSNRCFVAKTRAYLRAMPGNTFGQLFRLTTFGESHGAGIGGVVDGCPAGMELDLAALQGELDRRRPGSTALGTSRDEMDVVEFLSGILVVPRPSTHAAPQDAEPKEQERYEEVLTLGTPIGFIIRNRDAQSSDYDHLKDVYRPGHADRTWEQKYGLRDHRGGGRSSARETACRVVGGAIARQLLAREGVQLNAFVSAVGEVVLERKLHGIDLSELWDDPVRCPHKATSERMAALIEAARAEGDSVGGVVSCIVRGLPAGLGEPVFDKLDAELAKAMLSINATKGFQIGSGFRAAAMRGSEHNDPISNENASSSNSGGTLGGISTGGELHFDVAFKPPATISKAQRTMNTSGEEVTLEAKGRHDPCVVPRAVPIVEAMACLVLADHLLRQRVARV